MDVLGRRGDCGRARRRDFIRLETEPLNQSILSVHLFKLAEKGYRNLAKRFPDELKASCYILSTDVEET